MNIVISGGTGFLGRALILRLKRDGHSVAVLSRNTARAKSLLGNQASIVSSRLGARELDELVSTADAVVNLAGEPVLGRRWSPERKAAILQSRLDSTDQLVESIGRCTHRPAVFLSASAVGYYGDSHTEELNEGSDVGDTFLADVCQQWEDHALKAESLGVRVAIPRIGVVLGREEGALDKLVQPFKFGVGVRIGSGKQNVPWIHVEDLVELLVTALVDDRYSGPFNATAPDPATLGEVISLIGENLKRPVVPVPEVLIRFILGQQADVLLGSQLVKPDVARKNGFVYKFGTVENAVYDLLDSSDVWISRHDGSSLPESKYLEERHPAYLLETRTVLYCPIEEVFNFFSRAENLGLLTPPKMEFVTTSEPESLGNGAEIAYKLKVGGVPIGWRTRIEEWKPGRSFVDTQMKGPYTCWWHEHSFEADGDTTKMTDKVYYAPPAGILGRLLNSLFIGNELRKVFGYRTGVMRLRFGK